MSYTAEFNLSGRVALVTGGNRGIGRALALGLGTAGATMAIFGRNAMKNQAVLDELHERGTPALALQVDVTDRTALPGALKRVEAELGPLHVLVNNAGHVIPSGGVLNEDPTDWDSVIDSQLNSVFMLSKLAATAMATRKGGKIINIGSMYSFFGSAAVPSYSAAKGAVLQLTKSMAVELAPLGIQVNAIAPGWIATDMTAPLQETAAADEILGRTPAGRWGRPEDLIGAAVFLASSASDFVTGATICVDGGYSIR